MVPLTSRIDAKGRSIPAKKLLSFMAKNNRSISPLLILTHDFPDPDALGSAFALQFLAEKYFGISTKMAYRGDIGRIENRTMVRKLQIPIRKLKAVDFEKFQHVAMVDTQPAFENNPFPKNRQATIVIDQHSSLQKPNSRFSIVHTECGATSVILAQALLQTRGKIPVRIATALVYGILSDTDNLYRSSQEEVIRTYLRILPFCNLRTLSKIQNPQLSNNTFVTLGKGIQKAVLYKNLLVSHLGEVDNPDLVSQVADFLVRHRKASWCLCTGQHKGKLRLSLRTTKQDIDAGTILRSIMGKPSQAGGHGTIAGGSQRIGSNAGEKHWEIIQNELVSKLLKSLKLPLSTEPFSPFRW